MTTAPIPATPVLVTNRLSWGALWGGAFVALAIWIVLYTLGSALGLTSLNVRDPNMRSLGIITGIWGIVTPLIALFVGALITARAAGVIDRTVAVIHGLVVWALTTVGGALLIGMIVSYLVGGVADVTGKAVQSSGSALGQVIHGTQAGSSGSSVFSSLGLNPNELLQPVNQRLEAEGKPAVTAQQLEEAAQDVVSRAIQTGKLDRDTLTAAIADKTQLSRQDANQVADQIQNQFDARMGGSMQNGINQVQNAAQSAVTATGKAMWGVFIFLVLGAIASLVGAAVGLARDTRLLANGTTMGPMGTTGSTGPRGPATV